MTQEEFEVRGTHDEAVEHHARHEPLAQKIALFSAILATLGAIVSFLGGHEQNDALYYKNEAVLMKARASDAWAYYQAEDLKRHLAETSAALAPASTHDYAADAARYAKRGQALRATAEGYDRRSEEADAEARRALRPHTKLAIAMTFLQIGIALASISALTRRRWLLAGASAFALIGVALSIAAWF
ncbi:DUF4337 domain-containing protein [Sphingomonas kyungheensis]|uniref:DUF4337 domain-containing protein n=1 Tax=Sphingomonas kyungheensis TaxID=1069987 RepID=A0ABU8H5R3_9SPHN